MSLPKPAGYVAPPPPSVMDALRSLRVVFTDLVPYLARLALHSELPSPDPSEGSKGIKTAFVRTLRRAGVTLEVLHAERVPAAGGLVLMWNQESHLDHLVLGAAIPRPFLSLYNNEVARVPFYGEYMKRTGHLHIDRTNEAQWRASVARAAAQAQQGDCILVSPEGTRSWDGELLPMKRGAFLLATAAARPIICITVIGGHDRMPRGSAVVRRGPIRVVFSAPIPTAGETADRLALRVAETFRDIKAQYRLPTQV